MGNMPMTPTPQQMQQFAGTEYQNIVNPKDYNYIDPTGQGAGLNAYLNSGLGGAIPGAQGQYNALQAGLGQYLPGAANAQANNPMAAMYNQAFGGMGRQATQAVGNYAAFSPALIQQMQGATGPLQQALNQTSQIQSQQAAKDIAGQFGAVGALNSGAAAKAIAAGMAQPFAQANAQIAGQQLSGTQSLLGNLMGTLQQGQSSAQNYALGAAGAQTQAQSAANQYLTQLLGQQGQNYWAGNSLLGQLYGQQSQGLTQQGLSNAGLAAPQYTNILEDLMGYQNAQQQQAMAPFNNFMNAAGKIGSLALLS